MTVGVGYCCLKKENAPDPWRGTAGAFTSYMTKILHFGRSCKAYLRMYENRSPDVKMCCEDCGRSLHKHGRYNRSVTTKREIIQIPIYRQYCPDCGKTITLLPDFLVPWARFVTWVREAAMNRRQMGFTCRQTINSTSAVALRYSRRTLGRWWKRYVLQAISAALWVAGQLAASGSDEDLLRMYPAKIAPTPAYTLSWLDKLLIIYSPVRSWRRGYWSMLNTRLPASARL